MSIKVTIMIPTYNQGKYISEAIQSALNQTYDNLEIIISDDASNDRTSEICKSYHDNRVRYFRNEVNIGRVANYRKSLYERATGNWVINLDGDDFFIDDNFIKRAVNIISMKSITVYTAGMKVVKNQKSIRTFNPYKDKCVSGELLFYNWSEFGLKHLTTLYNRKVALDLDFYSEDIIASDAHSLLKILLHGDVYCDSSIVSCWRIHEKNESGIVDKELLFKNVKFIDDNFVYAQNLGFNNLVYWKRSMYNYYFTGILYRMNDALNLKDTTLLWFEVVLRYNINVLSLLSPLFIMKLLWKRRQLS